ncbi:MAG: DNA internalization-related competence protein ComEC/Rec2 [Acidaminococcaceae bacterium]
MNFLLWGVAAFALGDYVGLKFVPVLPVTVWGVLFLVFAGVFMLLWQQQRAVQVYVVVSSLFFLVCGLLLGTQAGHLAPSALKNHIQEELVISGTIVPGTVKLREDGNVSLQLQSEEQSLEQGVVPATGVVRVTVIKMPVHTNFPAYGRLQVAGKLLPISSYANPGNFDYELQGQIQGVAGRFTVAASQVKYTKTAKPIAAYLAEFSGAMKAKLAKTMPANDAALLAGMVLGGYEGIDVDTVRAFANTGIVHILSVSGSHIALVISFMLLVLGALKVKKNVALVITACTVLSYAAVCGFSPPILRSALMGMALLLGLSLEKDEDRGNVLAAVALLLLCYRPLWLLDIGFQLSFLSTAGLIFLLPAVTKFLTQYLPHQMAAILAVTVAAQLMVLPLLVYYFHQLAPCSLVANLVVVPAVESILILTLIGILSSFLVPVVGSLLLVGASLCLVPILRLNSWISQWPGAVVTIARTPIAMALVYYLLLWCLFRFYPWQTLTTKETTGVVVALVCVLVGQQFLQGLLPQRFTAYFLDVGQGDAAIVLTPEHKTIMIDTGGLQGNYNTGERIILPFLHYLGINKIDVLLLSHGHHDHAGGAARLAELIPIGQVLLPEEPPSEDVAALLHQLRGKSAIRHLVTGEHFQVGSCKLEVLAAPVTLTADTALGNESSAIIRLTERGQSLVFTGDATETEELGAASQLLPATVLKVSHHGSATSSCLPFISAVQPQLAVISVGANNHFGHPAEVTLERLKSIGSKVLRTDLLGAIKVVFDGSNVAWYSYRYQENKF